MSDTNSKMNPLVAAAAIAVIIFSAVGVGVMTGVIPSSRSSSEALTSPDTKTASAPEVKSVPAPAHKPNEQVARKRSPRPETKHQRDQVAMNETPPAAAPVSPPVARICAECGVIDRINVVEKGGQGSGLGAVGGAVVGGLLGHQIGSGRGNTAATVIGAAGGALAGNEVERRVKTVKEYHVTVRMDDGNARSFTFETEPGFAVGEKVKVIDGRLVKG